MENARCDKFLVMSGCHTCPLKLLHRVFPKKTLSSEDTFERVPGVLRFLGFFYSGSPYSGTPTIGLKLVTFSCLDEIDFLCSM